MSKVKYSTYKSSKTLWQKQIPSHWQETELRMLFSDNKNKNIGLIERNLLSLSYGKLKRKDIDNATGLVPASFEGYQIIDKDYIVLRFTDLQNDKKSLRVGYVNEKGIITNAYVGIVPKADIYSKYFYYQLHFLDKIKYFYNLGGGVRQSLAYKEFGREMVLIPPKEEQTAIAAFLDFKITKIDRFIRKKKQLIKLLNEQKAAIINQAVTKGLDPNAKMKPSGIDWLGDIPEHWEVSKVKYVKSSIKNSFVDGPFGSNLKSIHFIDNGDVYVVESGFITTGKFLDKEFKSISKEHFETISRSQCIEGDVIIAKIGANFGMGAILPKLDKLSVISGNSLKITLNDKKINKQYFVHLLSVYKKRGGFIEIVNASAQPALSLGGLNLLKMPLPSLNEQNSIIEFLNKEIEIIEDTISTIEKEIDLVEEYKTSLIAEAVTGKIDVRDFVIPEVEETESFDEIEDELSIAADGETEFETEETE